MIAAAVKLAKDSDVVILVLGDTPDEGDLASLLPLLHLPTHVLTYLLTYLLPYLLPFQWESGKTARVLT
jgi:hypothetical protein